MIYSKWETKEEMQKNLVPVNHDTALNKSGIPMMYDDKNIYINDKENHSLVIGSTGSGKTQAIMLPMIKLAIKANESFVVNDVKGEIYSNIASQLEKDKYKTIVLNFEDSDLGNAWNPLTFPYQLYKNGKIDKALEMVEDLGYYIFSDKNDTSDPFWVNSTIDYFTGLVLYLFENAKEEEINLNSILAITTFGAEKNGDEINFTKIMNKLDKNSIIYINLAGTLLAPNETRGSILSVFKQKIKTYVTREKLSKMMSKTDFDFMSIGNDKVAVFIVSGTSSYTNNLIPLLINQICTSVDMFGNKDKTLNILLDEFDSMLPIKNFAKLISYSRSIKIKFTVLIKSYIDLVNTYGKDNSEVIKMCFSNIIYLLANDIYTLEEISKYCGNQLVDNKVVPLISIEELKIMKQFEAIVFIPRTMPFRTKLLPDYEIDWKFDKKSKSMPKRDDYKINIYDVKNV